MRKTLRILGIVFGILLLLLIVAAIALPLIVDPNDYKPRIEAAVEDATGRQLDIPGNIELTVFPWLGVELGAVRLGNAAGFGDESFAAIEGVQVRVKLLPLLAGNLEVGKVVIEEPVIRLARNAEGVTNWDDLAGEGAADAPAEAEAEAPPEFSVDGLEIRNAQIFYSDAAANLNAELVDFNLEAGRLGLPADFPLKMSGALKVSEPELIGTFQFSGRIAADPEQQRFGVANGSLKLDAKGAGLPVSPLVANAEWQQLQADSGTGAATVAGLDLSALGVRVQATADIANFNEAPRATGNVAFSADDLQKVGAALGSIIPENLNLSGPASGRAEFMYDETGGEAWLRNAEFNVLGVTAKTHVEASGLPETSRAKGSFNVTAKDLAALQKQLGSLVPNELALAGEARANAKFEYDQAAGTAQVPEFSFAALNISGSGSVDVGKLIGQPSAEGKISIASDDLGITRQQLGTLVPADIARDGKGRFNATFKYDGAAGTAHVPVFEAAVLNVNASGNVDASDLNDKPSFKGKLTIAEFSPGQLLVKLGQELPEMRDGSALDSASLSATFDVKPNSAVISDLRATLDQSKLTGRVDVADIEKQALRFNLALDQIDVDRYLPPSAEESATPEEGPPLDQMEIPAELIRGHDVVGNMTIGKLKAFDFNSTDVKIGITAQNDKLRIHPAEAKFYGGGYRGDMRIDASGKVPVLAIDEHVQKVQLTPLVTDILDVENVSGTANIDITASARGKTVGAMKQSLDGKFAVAVKDGAIEGFNLWESIREAYATLKGRSHDASKAPQRTEFADLSASGTINNGVLRNDDLQAKLPFLRVAGKGSVDIAKATMDYTIEATVLKSPELSGGIEELTGTAIPVRLTGPVMDPKIRPDVKAVLEAKAKAELKKKEQELRDEAQRKLEEEKKRQEDKLKDKLKDLFG